MIKENIIKIQTLMKEKGIDIDYIYDAMELALSPK